MCLFQETHLDINAGGHQSISFPCPTEMTNSNSQSQDSSWFHGTCDDGGTP